MPKTLLALFASLVLVTTLSAQDPEFDTVRMATYNLLRFSGESTDRVDEFRMILDEIHPEILFVQELANKAGFELFRDSVLRQLSHPLHYGVFFENGTVQDSYVAIFIDTTLIRPVASVVVDDAPRVQGRLIIERGGEEVALFVAHYKAGDAVADELDRVKNAEATIESIKRFHGRAFFGCDCNVDGQFDGGYYALTETFVDPRQEWAFYDVMTWVVDSVGFNANGTWHDNKKHAKIHTQSTRSRQFGGGVGGGMDDRFDFIFVTAETLRMASYFSGSPGTPYIVFGNDGNHFNDSINAGTNTAVSAEMAQALHDASDHLPVYYDARFPKIATSVEERRRLPGDLNLSDNQ